MENKYNLGNRLEILHKNRIEMGEIWNITFNKDGEIEYGFKIEYEDGNTAMEFVLEDNINEDGVEGILEDLRQDYEDRS